MDNIQKKLLFHGFDFPNKAPLGDFYVFYYNDKNYFILNPTSEEIDIPYTKFKNIEDISLFHFNLKNFESLAFLFERSRFLSFRNNNLENLTHLECRICRELVSMNLSDNNIKDISVLSTMVLPKLKHLILDSNKINSIIPILYSDLPSLNLLILENNSFKEKDKTSLFSSLREKFPNAYIYL